MRPVRQFLSKHSPAIVEQLEGDAVVVWSSAGKLLKYSWGFEDEPPIISVDHPQSGDTLRGEVEITGRSWPTDSRGAVVVRIDDAVAIAGEAFGVWSLAFNGGGLADGAHTLWAAFGVAGRWSPAVEVGFTIQTGRVVDAAPIWVRFRSPDDGADVSGTIEVVIDADEVNSTERRVTAVELSAIGHQWEQMAFGGRHWSILLDTRTLGNGIHQLHARATVGEGWGGSASIRVVVENAPPPVPLWVTIDEPPLGLWPEGEDALGGNAGDLTTDPLVVEYRFWGGTWEPGASAVAANGSWSVQLAHSELEGAVLSFCARATRGGDVSAEHCRTFQRMPEAGGGSAPEVSDMRGTARRGAMGLVEVELAGSARDDHAVVQVQVREAHGSWETADGTVGWTAVIIGPFAGNGPYRLEARAFDGHQYSPVVSLDVSAPPPIAPGSSNTGGGTMPPVTTAPDDSGAVLIAASLAVGLVAATARWRLRRR
jgi:hypothetical protein